MKDNESLDSVDSDFEGESI